MTIARHDGKSQVCCDTCPASYPNTYADEDFRVMITDAKTAGWSIRKAQPPVNDEGTASLFGDKPRLARKEGETPQPYVHTCPDCAADERQRLL
ncbi:hypothetical protein [Nitratireductor luteus]|uniref:hypothetical protein n=1 Tax=Nitratireductor luteus TaxID=2976980 RepID=UPI00223F6E8D|nr:hypothetical protein [Nitratireductor luteus]